MTRLVPTSPLQRGVWFNEQVAALGSAYTVAVTADLRGPVDVGRLARACTALAARHPLLTAGCHNLDGLPWLAVDEHPLTLTVEPATDATVRGLVERATRTRFDLSAGPLARVWWFALADDRGVLVLAAHHLIVDGQSKDVLLRDLAERYGHDAPATATHPAGTGGHRDPGEHREHGPSEDLVVAAAEYWWRNPPRPVDLPGGARPGDAVLRVLTPRTRARLAGAADTLGATRFELLLTVLAGCLAAADGPTSIALELSVRTPAEAGRIGMYVNELPLTLPTPPTGPYAAALATVRAGLRQLYAHRTVPLARCRPGTRPFLATAAVSVSYRRIAPGPVFPGLATTVDWSPFNGVARNALHVMIADGEQTRVTFQFPASAGARRRADALIDHVLAVLDRSLAAPQEPVVRPSEEPPPWT
ncbi:condensation domain-containing protein [Micromonospora wenchangensis]|uniref:condensation domain-containing protein n=1 Tax=Micromonospora wenchangensis TaxID=1185415 RepID=UPI003D7665EA